MDVFPEAHTVIGFLIDKPGGMPIGTGFFINYEGFDYLVTAAHVASDSPTGIVRINTNDGRCRDLKCETPARWTVHRSATTDEVADVAVWRVVTNDDTDDVRTIPRKMFVTDAYIAEIGVGYGDKVFFFGMFHGHPGRNRIEPILRYGTIAAMPAEKVRHEWGRPRTARHASAYFIEQTVPEGFSGSPVFVYYGKPDGIRPLTSNKTYSATEYLTPALLGVLHGSYTPDSRISVVTPAQYILETLQSETLVRERKALSARRAPSEHND